MEEPLSFPDHQSGSHASFPDQYDKNEKGSLSSLAFLAFDAHRFAWSNPWPYR